jgi:streptogramin lyase
MLTSPTGMVAEGDRLWITSQEGVLTSIDPESLQVTSETDLGHPVLGPPIFAFGSLWTAALDENVVLRVDVARIRQSSSR